MAEFKSFPPKSPEGKLDYVFDWAPLTNHRGHTNWLREGEIITAYAVAVPAEIDKVSDSLIDEGTAVLVWLEGGVVGDTYEIACSIETNQEREETRTGTVTIKKR